MLFDLHILLRIILLDPVTVDVVRQTYRHIDPEADALPTWPLELLDP